MVQFQETCTNIMRRIFFRTASRRLIKQHEKNVADITINTPFLTDDVIPWLATQKQLRSVKLAPNYFTDPAAREFAWNLEPLESLSRLEKLELVHMRISDQTWLAIGRMQTLTSLAIYGCRIDSHGSLPLANLKALQFMEIDNCNVDDRFFAGLHELPCLKRLHLGGGREGKFTAAGLGSLAKTNLTELYLNSIDFGNAEIDALNEISSLQIIAGVPDKEAAKFEKHPNLLKVNNRIRSSADGSPLVDPNAPGEKIWALQPSEPLEKSSAASSQTSLPNHPDAKSKALKSIPLTIEPSENTAGERVDAFAGRKDVLKTKVSNKADEPTSMNLEVQLPDDKEILVQRPDRLLYLSLSVLPPAQGTAKLIVSEKQRPQMIRFLGDLNQLDSVHQVHRDMITRKEGWYVVRIPLIFLEADTKRFSIKLIVDANSPAEACWANPEMQMKSHVTYEEVDPTNQTLFQSYLKDGSYPNGQLVDAATGNVLKQGIGIGWGGSKTSCLFSSDGSHVAIISRYHDNSRDRSDYEKLWLFGLRPFRQIREAESARFSNIRFADDNTALLFESGGRPRISGP
jgi:hypothetical protein